MTHFRSLMKPADTIRAYDLVDDKGQPKDFTMEIVKVVPGKVFSPDSNKTDPMPMIYFKGAKKPLGCNVTNAETISSLAGSKHIEKWVGTKVTLYQTMVRAKAGGKVEGVRIRPRAPTVAAESLPDREPDQDMIDRQASAAREPGDD